MADDPILKPCPFCGSDFVKPHTMHTKDGLIGSILCNSCGLIASFRGSEGFDATVMCWQTRKGDRQ